MMTTLLTKFGLPLLIAALCGGGAYFYGYKNGVKDQPEVKLSCPQCPTVTCPPSVELNSIDMDKIGKKNNIHISNNISNVSINVDSTMFDAIARKAGYKR